MRNFKNIIIIITVISIVLITLKLWVGIYQDDEFPEQHLFIKHKPTWKTYFYSPVGLTDLTLSDLSEERQKEQLLYNEFVLRITPKENK